MEQDAASIVRRFYDDVVNKGALDAIDEIVDEAHVNHGPFPWGVRDIGGLKKFSLVHEVGFPDVRATIDEIIGERDLAAFRTIVRGTDTGEFLGLDPTGGRLEVSAIGFARVVGDRTLETWGVIDELGLLDQIGVDVQSIRQYHRPLGEVGARGAAPGKLAVEIKRLQQTVRPDENEERTGRVGNGLDLLELRGQPLLPARDGHVLRLVDDEDSHSTACTGREPGQVGSGHAHPVVRLAAVADRGHAVQPSPATAEVTSILLTQRRQRGASNR